MKRLLAVVGIVLGLGLVSYALLSGASDEDLIRERLERLAELVAVEGKAGNVVVRSLQLRGAFQDVFEDRVTTSIPELGSAGQDRDALATLAARSTVGMRFLVVEFDGVEIALEADGSMATVVANATLTGQRSGEVAPRRDQRHVRFRFTKSESHGWRISGIRVGVGDQPPAPDG